MAKQYICEYCGLSFTRRGRRPHKYCTKKCFDDARRICKEVLCIQCGTAFIQKRPHTIHCSDRCAKKTLSQKFSQKVICTCIVCGKQVSRSPAQVTAYCSPSCYWKSKFTTPEGYKKWRHNQDFRSTQRKAIKTRDNFQCVICGSKDRIQVDHILAVGLGGTNSIDNGQTLCHACHVIKSRADRKLIKLKRL